MPNESSIGTSSNVVITFPDKLWLGTLSREFPYHEIIIESFIPIKTQPFIGNALIRIIGKKPKKLLKAIEDHHSLLSYFIMEETANSITINSQTKDNFLLAAIVQNAIMVKFPIKISKGKGDFKISGARQNIDEFLNQLEQKGITSELKNIGNFSSESDNTLNILTPRQNFVYQKARELGYYESPRKINLTELAKELGIAKSTLSAMLQRIHKKLLGN